MVHGQEARATPHAMTRAYSSFVRRQRRMSMTGRRGIGTVRAGSNFFLDPLDVPTSQGLNLTGKFEVAPDF